MQRLYSINEQPYRELVLELYSSYGFTLVTSNSQSSIPFRLYGRKHRISLSRFVKLLDIYPSDAAKRSHLGSFVEVENHQKRELWTEITGLPLQDSHRCKASSILDPKAILGDAYIIKQEIGMGLMTSGMLASLTAVGSISSLSLGTFKSAKITKKVNNRWVLLGRNGAIWDEGQSSQQADPGPSENIGLPAEDLE